MEFKLKDVKIETMRGTGKGGQHKNKTDSAVRVTHIPTGLTAYVDGRKQGQNKAVALKELQKRVENLEVEEKAKKKKERRDDAIRNTKTIRTYDYKKQIVINHLNGKRVSLKEVMEKGRIDLLQDEI